MNFDFSWIEEPTPEELKAEGANYTQSSAAGAYPGYRTLSEETKQKISNSLKGNVPWNKGKKTGPLSAAQRKKMSESHTKYTEEERLDARKESYRKYREKNKKLYGVTHKPSS